ncbi:MAG: hypothetical protein KKG47_08985 [Proteobacteria bacterium]|nr:hypothetical protein [Pseudomonadota bacterium]MBU1739009.1 hypothetical protein [Pseudomonadota bacterium]
MNNEISLNRGVVMAVLCLSMLFYASFVFAAPQVVELEGVGYNVSHSLNDNLKAFTGKKVYVTLDSGKTLAGTVKGVGEHLLHLEKIEGKEYFDALIRIEEIGAIDVRFREQKR